TEDGHGRVSATRRHLIFIGPLSSASYQGPTVATTIACRLVGDARVISAVGQPGRRLAAAKEEVRAARVADRPAAGLFSEFQDAAPLPHRDDVVDVLGFRIHVVVVDWRQRGGAAHYR